MYYNLLPRLPVYSYFYFFIGQVIDIVRSNVRAVLQRAWHTNDIESLKLSRIFNRVSVFIEPKHMRDGAMKYPCVTNLRLTSPRSVDRCSIVFFGVTDRVCGTVSPVRARTRGRRSSTRVRKSSGRPSWTAANASCIYAEIVCSSSINSPPRLRVPPPWPINNNYPLMLPWK